MIIKYDINDLEINPYFLLIGAVIKLALNEANMSNKEIEQETSPNSKINKLNRRKDARMFFCSKTFEKYCFYTNINPNYIRKALTTEALKECKKIKEEKRNGRKNL